ncbi:7.5 kDa CHLOROSOME PROTEIN [Granulibacter bethesdensis]|uniref:7.5 kDa CHLOROSOME PROTEIN n=2 Tax=Granulibacter bethesdensis TaxID=364410 RepID=A0AAN0RFN1_9PROT|nr:7.5 kDa CHLOROSOME PROTEIN [Granulibacter bethesdensis]AHJ65523.1 7.5 kDa CHLOROSOME PROTEIN [Granulibacter bethesdensis CGDNIH4]
MACGAPAPMSTLSADTTMREDAITRFLAEHGCADFQRTPLAGDASFRRYWRLRDETGATLVLMDAPPPHEAVEPFLRIASAMEGTGLSVPHIEAANVEAGLVLLEDLGDALYRTLLDDSNADAFGEAAASALTVLHRMPMPPDPLRWDGAAMRDATSDTFLGWWWPATFGETPSARVIAALHAALDETLSILAASPPVPVHRDFEGGNLLWLPQRDGFRRTGIIDFQDLGAGHGAYDLVSLTQDARREMPDGFAEQQIARYATALGLSLDPTGPDSLPAACAVCAAQRHMRHAGLWVRLAQRDGKTGYLTHGPRSWRRLLHALTHPANQALMDFFNDHVPASRRGNPALLLPEQTGSARD